MKVKCTVCGKVIAGKIPSHGDGSVCFPYRHKGEDGKPCPGNIQRAEDIFEQSQEASDGR